MIGWLSESVSYAPLGQVVSWRTPTGPNMGIVIGSEDKVLIVVTTADKSLWLEPGDKLYRDDVASAKLGSVRGLPRVRIEVYRVPKALALRRGRLKGLQLKPYVRMVKMLHGPVKLGGQDKIPVVGTLEAVFGA
jgi:hypothetical protein